MWFVALQPCQGQPCDCFEHLLVITLSTWAEPLRKKNGAHNVVKRGIRTMLLLLGIPPKLIFCCERLSASMARSLHLSFICIPRSTRALDQGGVEPRQAVSPRPGGQGRYRFTTASAGSTPPWSRARVDCGIQIKLKSQRPGHTGRKAFATKKSVLF